MSLQFSRSLRSLDLDSFRAARWGMILAILLLLALLLWFFFGQLTLYETSKELRLAPEGRLEADFSSQALERIHPGQAALLRFDAGPNQPLLTLPALVIGVDEAAGAAELLIMSEDIPLERLQGKLAGRAEVQVEVEYVAPATLVLRASGKYLEGRRVPVSPGSFEETEGR